MIATKKKSAREIYLPGLVLKRSEDPNARYHIVRYVKSDNTEITLFDIIAEEERVMSIDDISLYGWQIVELQELKTYYFTKRRELRDEITSLQKQIDMRLAREKLLLQCGAIADAGYFEREKRRV